MATPAKIAVDDRYDFYAYAAFALYFASSFFPGTDPVVQQLNAAVLFAFGFIVRRPIRARLVANRLLPTDT